MCVCRLLYCKCGQTYIHPSRAKHKNIHTQTYISLACLLSLTLSHSLSLSLKGYAHHILQLTATHISFLPSPALALFCSLFLSLQNIFIPLTFHSSSITHSDSARVDFVLACSKGHYSSFLFIFLTPRNTHTHTHTLLFPRPTARRFFDSNPGCLCYLLHCFSHPSSSIRLSYLKSVWFPPLYSVTCRYSPPSFPQHN
ncbi:hypothetical protein BC939DRAFT_164391 [Gamsiella multidivaricata]|uniref:uncharacterized protein n=1 Tax=Gamsiella multidivaricata TaxID=101098 RepID=UPI00221EBA98|nr:uncharacterized protein BC939DRAFT_164391 [Gamsiella multidivaricata]KAI7823366.1 hypothetical protein BC939DRAFT_164391 [Gamsiella multidivaricata]